MALLGRWQMSPIQVDIIRKYLRIGELTQPLDVPSVGRTMEEFQRITRPEYERMQQSGVVVNDEVEPVLESAFKLLAHPYLWVDSVWFPEVGGDHAWRTLAVLSEGNRVVLGVQPPSDNPRYGGLLTVEVYENVPLAQVVLPTLPPAPPGNRGKVEVPASSLKPAEEAEESVLGNAVPSRGSSGDRQVELYYAIGQAEHTRLGQIAANLRDRHGKIRRTPVLSWFDNVEPDGRYLNQSARGSTGETMYLLTPADARLLGSQVEKLVAEIRSQGA